MFFGVEVVIVFSFFQTQRFFLQIYFIIDLQFYDSLQYYVFNFRILSYIKIMFR